MLPSVSVVIPTIGREHIRHAVASVRRQDYQGAVQIVVSVDNADAISPSVRGEISTLADVVTESTARRGGGAARNAGVACADGAYVAYLDDDDLWEPDKLSRQVTSALVSADDVVQSCRLRYANATGKGATVIPRRSIENGEQVQDYLFRRRQPSRRRQSLYTSTLLHVRQMALDSPWNERLKRHQDWDYLLRLQQNVGARVRQLDESLVRISVGSSSSISATSDWRESLHFAIMWKDSWEPQTTADFIVAQPLRYALQARSGEGVRSCWAELRSIRVTPSIGPSLIGIAGLAGRKSIERMMTR